MRFLLRKNLFVQALELALNALDLLSCRFALLAIELRRPRPRCPPLRAVHNRGHHLQVAIAQERTAAHPITRYFGFSGFSEGWALYSESLADQMGLYSSAVARMGFLTNRAWRAARLVIDAGIHSRGWTREQAVEYLGRTTTLSPIQLQGEVDRYISWPGQATSYMLGDLEIRKVRAEAEQRLGAQFDIRKFHDRVLGNGSVTLPMLRRQVERWVPGAKGAE